MIHTISSVGSGPLYPTRPTSRTSAAAPSAGAQGDTTIPDTPPADVLHALDRAQQTMAELKARSLELRFEVGDGKIRAQMIDSDGNVVREMPARHGLDVLAGGNLVDHHA
jgi:hypothetical protein